jgi:putative transposase
MAHCVWLYFRFSLSFRDIEEMMLERGAEVSYEAIRLWCLRFGAEYGRRLRRQRGRAGDMWHLDEVFCKINGELVYLWRAVDQSGEVLDVRVQKRRDAKAAKRFFRKLLKGHRYVPRFIVTDKLASYAAATKQLMPSVTHHRGRGLNNRAEKSHEPTRARERVMRRFKSMRQALRFLSVHAQVSNHFRPGRHSMRASNCRTLMAGRFASWSEITGMSRATATCL